MPQAETMGGSSSQGEGAQTRSRHGQTRGNELKHYINQLAQQPNWGTYFLSWGRSCRR